MLNSQPASQSMPARLAEPESARPERSLALGSAELVASCRITPRAHAHGAPPRAGAAAIGDPGVPLIGVVLGVARAPLLRNHGHEAAHDASGRFHYLSLPPGNGANAAVGVLAHHDHSGHLKPLFGALHLAAGPGRTMSFGVWVTRARFSGEAG